MWMISEGTKGHPEVSLHNHKPSKHPSAHFSNRRPTQAEKEEMLRLSKAGVKAARIITVLQQNQEGHDESAADILTGPRNIANIIATNREQANNRSNNAASAIELLQSSVDDIRSQKIRTAVSQTSCSCLQSLSAYNYWLGFPVCYLWTVPTIRTEKATILTYCRVYQ